MSIPHKRLLPRKIIITKEEVSPVVSTSPKNVVVISKTCNR